MLPTLFLFPLIESSTCWLLPASTPDISPSHSYSPLAGFCHDHALPVAFGPSRPAPTTEQITLPSILRSSRRVDLSRQVALRYSASTVLAPRSFSLPSTSQFLPLLVNLIASPLQHHLRPCTLPPSSSRLSHTSDITSKKIISFIFLL